MLIIYMLRSCMRFLQFAWGPCEFKGIGWWAEAVGRSNCLQRQTRGGGYPSDLQAVRFAVGRAGGFRQHATPQGRFRGRTSSGQDGASDLRSCQAAVSRASGLQLRRHGRRCPRLVRPERTRIQPPEADRKPCSSALGRLRACGKKSDLADHASRRFRLANGGWRGFARALSSIHARQACLAIARSERMTRS